MRGWWCGERSTKQPVPSEPVPDGLRQVAAAVEIGAPTPVRLPFRVGFRPPGLTPVNVLTDDAADLRRTVEYDRVGGTARLARPLRATCTSPAHRA